MLKVDEFESVFRSAIKETYQHQDIRIKSVLLVTDLDTASTEQLLTQVKEFCFNLINHHNIEFNSIEKNQFKSAEELLELINQTSNDLIITYRNLHNDAWRHPFSLGEYLDIMLQMTTTPVLVIPHPKAGYARDNALDKCRSAMVVTDQLVNDHPLIRYALAFIAEFDNFYLSHIENQAYFNRVINAISKIPTIDTDEVRQKLSQQLLKEPLDYIESVKTELEKLNRSIRVESIVKFGHQLKDYIKLIEEKHLDLLVINTKDGEQMAMHGLAYPLAVEIRQIPLLML